MSSQLCLWTYFSVDDHTLLLFETVYFDYLFYIDFEASMAEPRAQSALGQLQEFATFLRVLGCYPMDTAL
ncbi:hypothetical protein RHGRI_017912 [Rhododendron griersonianum]|uniref:Arogenate dehydratase n=1 Tax=Rhododendron griersonianum TaxID=479676 RepID=A0AAV6JZH7_9ERIC|nr:hypothetical protein RHGRI_017912 [Rhododendron griersonianum]